MSRKLKLICRILKNPKYRLSLPELERIIENEGGEFVSSKGSHRKYRYQDLSGKIDFMVFPVHGKEIKTPYTKKLIEKLELYEKYADVCSE